MGTGDTSETSTVGPTSVATGPTTDGSASSSASTIPAGSSDLSSSGLAESSTTAMSSLLPVPQEPTTAPGTKACIMSPHIVNALSNNLKMDNVTVGDVTNTFSSIIERLFLHCGAGDTFSIKIEFSVDMIMDNENGHISHSHSIE